MDLSASNTLVKDKFEDPVSLKLIKHYQSSLSWFDLRVFYVRITHFEPTKSIPESLALHHIPLSPNTLLEVNGARTAFDVDFAPTLLQRVRVDRKAEEATFVGIDRIRLTGSVKFEVLDQEELILSGAVELLTRGNGAESKGNSRKWKLSCQAETTAAGRFLRPKQPSGGPEQPPMLEVYVAGRFEETPIVLTKTLQLGQRKKHNWKKAMLDAIPENEASEGKKDALSGFDLQFADYRSNYKLEKEEEYMYRGTDYIEGEDGELSWFNAGVRVGVGIGLGLCVGLGIGVGLLAHTYQATARNFKRRFL